MSFRTPLTIALALGALGLMPKASATAPGPYIVYDGSITTVSRLSSPDDLAFAAAIKGTGNFAAKFSLLPPTLRTKVGTYLGDQGGTVADRVYLVTDESNVANYAVVIVDPTANKVISTTVSGASLTAAQAQDNFISGFKYTKISSDGGLGVFRFSYTHNTRTDPASGTVGSYVAQVTATGPIDDLSGLYIIPARTAQNLRVVTAGVLQKTIALPGVARIASPAGDDFIDSFVGTVQGYYFDDTSTSSVAASTTAGTISLAFDSALSVLANDGGGYEATTRYIGYIPAIQATNPPTTGFQTFVNNIISTYPNPVP